MTTVKNSSKGNKGYKKKVTGGVTLTVLRLIQKDYYAKQIADELKKSKVTIHRHIKKLLKLGYIRHETRSNINIYIVTSKGENAIKSHKLRGKSYPTTIHPEEMGVHDIYIKLPIIRSGHPRKGYWKKINRGFRNSIQKHRFIGLLNGSIRETSKHICIQLRPRTLDNYSEVYGLISGTIGYVTGELSRQGYELDFTKPSVSGIHLTYRDGKSQELINKQIKVKVPLGRNRKKILPLDPKQTAFVWLDKTPSDNWETNDYDHAKLRALEPENVASILHLMEIQNEQIAIYAEHLNKHMPVLDGMDKLLKILHKRFAQKSINEYR